MMTKKYLSLLLLTVLLIVPAIHKVTNPMPPDWFVEKFSDSFIGIVPGGISMSYFVILALEIVGPVLLVTSLFLMITKRQYHKMLSAGFITCYLLFIVLTFGSFLVEDYDNGFRDFIYFVGILYVDNSLFSIDKNKGD